MLEENVYRNVISNELKHLKEREFLVTITPTCKYKHKADKKGLCENVQDNSTLAYKNENSEKKCPNKQLRQLAGSVIKSAVSQDYRIQHLLSGKHHFRRSTFQNGRNHLRAIIYIIS